MRSSSSPPPFLTQISLNYYRVSPAPVTAAPPPAPLRGLARASLRGFAERVELTGDARLELLPEHVYRWCA